MKQLPTAEDVLNSVEPNGELLNTDIAIKAMIQFTKLHIEQALEDASEKVGLSYKQSILNAYPLDNIK